MRKPTQEDVKLLFAEIPKVSKLQDLLNERTTPNWKEANLNWARAFYKEACEISDHIPWKWWKKEEPCYPQAFMEVVDMFHFWMSAYILSKHKLKNRLFMSFEINDHGYTDVNNLIDGVVGEAAIRAGYVDHNSYSVVWMRQSLQDIVALTYCFGYTINDLLLWYVGKCALNFFRQDYGYKEGTYIKVWEGKEDNHYLEEIIKHAPKDKLLTARDIWNQLKDAYTKYGMRTPEPNVICSIPDGV